MKFFLPFVISLMCLQAWAQPLSIKGIVRDSLTQEPLVGVSVRVGEMGTRTRLNGEYTLTIPKGITKVVFSYTGYVEQNKTIDLNEAQTLDILLSPKSKELNTITVSGSRFAKRVAEEIVSIEVIKPAQILNQANNSMDDALQRVPGVDIVENQVNIRGGSGWSYGAGSRVMVLVDDMPMLSADAGDAKFDFLPLENCEQVEVLKALLLLYMALRP